jgi:chromosome partitioning protein
MAIIAVLNPKGGSGKSTLSTTLAKCMSERGQRVLLVDSDPQGSARDWHAASEDNPLPLVALDRPSTLKGLPGIAAPYEHTVIDGESKVQEMLAAAIKVADTILIPVQPSPYDIWAASDLVELVKTRQTIPDGSPRAAFVITRSIKNTRLSAETTLALFDYELPIFSQSIMQRQAYPQTAADGLTVFESTNSEAIIEFESFTNELMQFIDTPQQDIDHGVISETA